MGREPCTNAYKCRRQANKVNRLANNGKMSMRNRSWLPDFALIASCDGKQLCLLEDVPLKNGLADFIRRILLDVVLRSWQDMHAVVGKVPEEPLPRLSVATPL